MPLFQVLQSILKGFLLWLVSTTMIHLLNDSQPAGNWNINPAPVAQTNTAVLAGWGCYSVARVCVRPLYGLVLVLHVQQECIFELWNTATQQ